MQELRFTHPDQPGVEYPIALPDGEDPAGRVASMTDSGWVLESDPEADSAPAEVPVGDPISLDLTPEPSADTAAPAEPETTVQPVVADAPKE
jgi:hypothetical protein